MQRTAGYFQRKRILRRANYLDLTPVARHPHEINADGLVCILIPKFSEPILGKWLQPRLKHPNMRLSLDEKGSATWLLCDGKHNVRAICQAMRERFGPDVEPAEDRITRFLSHFYKQKLITFRELFISPSADESPPNIP